MEKTTKSTAGAGFRMPAEWEAQRAIWLAWPHNKNDWPERFGPIPWVYVEFIRALAPVVKIELLVKSEKQRDEAKNMLRRAGVPLKQLRFHIIRTNRIWLRDSGPIFVEPANASFRARPEADEESGFLRAMPVRNDRKKKLLDWGFTAWAKYPDHKLDNKVPQQVNHTLKLERITPMHKGRHVVLEGGGIDVNGAGCILTTEEWLLSDTQIRNPGFTREDYESLFEHYLGATHTIWLGDGIIGDDTHGHVDDLARFVNPTTIATVIERDRKDDNYTRLQENLKRLKKARDAKGKPFTILELPMPKPVLFEGERLPASYANFLIANGRVLVPTFNDPADRVALSLLAEAMPKHEVMGIHCGDFIWGLGTLHCASQQEPA